ncbi:type III-B CRISPR module RAMP protein Cmr4 [Pueribacillus theae]|uniref:Type III-B CRISPR module RAMP protein Cmr4 n=1 Tax=Pueribacillus theae TaxID=2171751 RepID=A0A2U1K6C1_9BACI|nr:type III-B CRISPR module RAMP protein Cmr4 [Pueribacillus theae]PWA13086.1 type III-B CRISPR module RAMP protein Cmr4 [Pueribacillus theae]
MFSNSNLFLLHAVTSVHVGSGSELGIVDLPIQREKHTGFPKIESSSLKGAIRASNQSSEEVNLIFGKKKDETSDDIASAVSFSDARTLLFPVKSMRNIFAYVTCPAVLKRFNYECNTYDHAISLPVPEAETCSSEKVQVGDKKHVVLEEYAYKIRVNEITMQLAEKLEKVLFGEENQGHLKERLVILSDDDFTDFVKLSTEVNPRIRVSPETGTVKDRALFYEENVPPETVFYSFVFASHTRVKEEDKIDANEVMEKLTSGELFPEVFQLGGNSTLGRGVLRRTFIKEV